MEYLTKLFKDSSTELIFLFPVLDLLISPFVYFFFVLLFGFDWSFWLILKWNYVFATSIYCSIKISAVLLLIFTSNKEGKRIGISALEFIDAFFIYKLGEKKEIKDWDSQWVRKEVEKIKLIKKASENIANAIMKSWKK